MKSQRSHMTYNKDDDCWFRVVNFYFSVYIRQWHLIIGPALVKLRLNEIIQIESYV